MTIHCMYWQATVAGSESMLPQPRTVLHGAEWRAEAGWAWLTEGGG